MAVMTFARRWLRLALQENTLAEERGQLYAQSDVMRSGASRTNDHSTRVFVAIDGVHHATAPASETARVLDGSLSITDVLNETPNTASCEVVGFAPDEGSEVIITLGSKHNFDREFGGRIISPRLHCRGRASTGSQRRTIALIDFTWGMNRRKVTQRWEQQSISAIARDLIATYCPGYTARRVEAGLPTIEIFSARHEDVTAVLSRLAKRAGAQWYMDYLKDLHFFTAETHLTNPTDLTDGHPTLASDQSDVAVERGLDQIITRVTFEGGGVRAVAEIQPGESIIPLEPGDWYEDEAGGTIVTGEQAVDYAAYLPGGAGSLVGPGAAPSAAPAAALASGSGIEDGVHQYAQVFVTGAGKSLPSPIASVTHGLVAAPTAAPSAGTPTIGSGPNPGTHEYAYTLVTSAGETTPSPTVSKATTTTSDPVSAPSGVAQVGASGPDDGTHHYAYTFVTSIGETLRSGGSAAIATTNGQSAPSSFGSAGWGTGGGGAVDTGDHKWAYTFRRTSDGAETTLSPLSPTGTVGGSNNLFVAIPLSQFDAAPSGYTRVLYRTKLGDLTRFYECNDALWGTGHPDYVHDVESDASLGSEPPAANETQQLQVAVSGIAVGGAGVIARKLYRKSGATYKLVATINDNTTTVYTDTTPNSGLGADEPASNTAYVQRIPLTLPVSSNPLVTHLNVYGTAAGSAQLKFIATVTNGTTSYTVTTTDAGLGANAPSSNTAAARRTSLTGIAVGGSGVTDVEIYRTTAGGAQLKLLTTLTNGTTTYTDSTPDASLGANAPTTDTSGLAQPDGVVLQGATSLLCAGTGWAAETGGWAVIGNGQQVIRYTGIAGGSLIGIPASGPGAITASIAYNSTVTAAPCLTGIPTLGEGSIRYPILPGDDINLFVQVDDPAAQAALAALTGDPDDDGVREEFLQDRRLSRAEALARAQAYLDLHKDVAVRIRYTTRDINTRSGRIVTINLGPPYNITGEFVIQSVTISNFQPAIFPLYDVEASSTRFTYEDLLRLVRAKEAA